MHRTVEKNGGKLVASGLKGHFANLAFQRIEKETHDSFWNSWLSNSLNLPRIALAK